MYTLDDYYFAWQNHREHGIPSVGHSQMDWPFHTVTIISFVNAVNDMYDLCLKIFSLCLSKYTIFTLKECRLKLTSVKGKIYLVI